MPKHHRMFEVAEQFDKNAMVSMFGKKPFANKANCGVCVQLKGLRAKRLIVFDQRSSASPAKDTFWRWASWRDGFLPKHGQFNASWLWSLKGYMSKERTLELEGVLSSFALVRRQIYT